MVEATQLLAKSIHAAVHVLAGDTGSGPSKCLVYEEHNPCVRGILFSEKTDNKNVCEVPVSARERESRAGKWWSGEGEARESVVDAAVLSDELGGDVV